MQQEEFIKKIVPIKDKMYRLAKRILISHDEAEDAVQEVFAKILKDTAILKSVKNHEAFAMTMIKNYCLDRLKSKQASNLTLVHSNYTQETRSLEKQIEAEEGAGMVFEIIKKLPEHHRIILQLRDVEGYEYQEIAKIVEMNETAVRVTLSRARKAVREAYLKKQNYGLTKS